jgi:hypothetical protein
MSLVPGTTQPQRLGINLSGPYQIDIDFEQVPALPRLDCRVGNAPFDPGGCAGMSDLIDVTWRLFDGGRGVLEGNSRDSPMVESSSPFVYRRIGEFTAQKGHEYKLSLEVGRGGSMLDAAHPKLDVRVPRAVAEDRGVGAGFEELAAMIAGFIGVLILAAGIVMYAKSPTG